MVNKYLVTIKDLHNDANPTRLDYVPVVHDMLRGDNRSVIHQYAWETDSRGVLHLHLIFSGNCSFTKLRKKHDFSIDFAKITHNEQRVKDYLNKQNLNQYECEQCNIRREIQSRYPYINY